MLRATRTDKAAEEEFLHQLYRGGELLAAGKVIEAKDHLERAFKLQPRNEKGQNLLGLTYFKLGLFDRAAEIYETLVQENPADPTLRVNLGLVYLKSNALQRAIREFETATDLAPDHSKAQNYLGLALAQAGEYGRAREHFRAAGSEAMVEKMGRALAGEAEPVAAPEGEEPRAARSIEESSTQPPAPEEETFEVMSDEEPPPSLEEPSEAQFHMAGSPSPLAVAAADWGAQLRAEADRPGQSSAATHAPGEPLEAHAEVVQAPAEAVVSITEEVGSAETADGISASFAEHPGRADEPTVRELEISDLEAPVAEAALSLEVEDLSLDAPASAVKPAPSDGVGSSTDGVEIEVEEPPRPAELVAEVIPHPAVRLGAPAGPGLEPIAAPALLELGPKVLLGRAATDAPFQLSPEALLLVVRGELLSRLTGMVAYAGALKVTPEAKRFRGKGTDRPFGEGADRLMRLAGEGAVYLARGSRRFAAVDLDDESAYFRECCVFAFEEPVMFENGRLMAEVAPDLELVHLRGKGRVLLRMDGELRSLEVQMDRPVTAPFEQLVGWQGTVTPRLVPTAWDDSGKPSRMGVELSGEGYALLSLAVSRG
ncbi:MAG: tetratricopeptide repeat protein [Myxococcales bacterium]|nr:tetratricopeptide repeat protein [Myxococcales bacterium]